MPQDVYAMKSAFVLPVSCRFFMGCFFVVVVFSLSKLQLKTGDLDPRLFSRLRHLQKLDLSDNLLDKFPNSLTLPDLRVLNCNNNKLEDVTALKQFPLLEELTYENNVYLTVSYPPPSIKHRGKQTALVQSSYILFLGSKC